MKALGGILSPFFFLSLLSSKVIAVQGSSRSVLGKLQMWQTYVALGSPLKQSVEKTKYDNVMTMMMTMIMTKSQRMLMKKCVMFFGMVL